jgi:hypothetical protein
MTTFAERLISAPHVKLTDTAWDEIARDFKLPLEARGHIDRAISIFAKTEIVQDENYSPAATKKSLRDLADLASNLRRGLRQLLGNHLAIVTLSKATSAEGDFESTMNDRTPKRVLVVEIAALEHLEHSLKAASDKVAKARSGAAWRARRIAILVKLLDQILFQFTGRQLKRDSKGKATGRDFLAAVSTATDLKIRPGSFDEALKQVVKGRGGISGGTAR